MAVAGDGPAAGEKRCYLGWFHRIDLCTFSHKTGKGTQTLLIAFKTLAEAFPEGDVFSHQLREFHSKPPKLRFATSRSLSYRRRWFLQGDGRDDHQSPLGSTLAPANVWHWRDEVHGPCRFTGGSRESV